MRYFIIFLILFFSMGAVYASELVSIDRWMDVKRFVETTNGVTITKQIQVIVDKKMIEKGYYDVQSGVIYLKQFRKNILAHELGHVILRELIQHPPKEFDEHFAQWNEIQWERR